MDQFQFRYGDLGEVIDFKDQPKSQDKFSKLFEIIQKETGISKEYLVIIDEKGVDYSTCNPDDILSSRFKSNSDQATVLYLLDEQRELAIQRFFEEEKRQQANTNNITINNGLIESDIEENYNFKPIFAAASLIGNVDLTLIQNFEQQFFNDYTMMKKAYKKFKFNINRGYKSLKTIEQQNTCLEVINKSIKATYDQMYQQKQILKTNFQKTYMANLEILKTYKDSLDEIKKYQLHPVLQKDGKKYLSDIYYDETQMNKWRDTCAKSNESLKIKIEKIDKEFSAIRERINLIEKSSDGLIEESKLRDLNKQLESIVQEIDPLMLSIITTVFDELKEMHSHFNKICSSDPQQKDIRAAQIYLSNIDQFKRKIKEHTDLQLRMEEHSRSLDKVLDSISNLRLRNANIILKTCQKDSIQRKEFKKSSITFDSLKILFDNLARVEKDFSYLKQPSELPRVYERSLVEVQRRRRFRKLVEDEIARIQKFIHKEKEFRIMYKNECSKKKPTDFLPQLDESIPILRLEGGNNDSNLPEIEDLSLSEFDDFFNLLGENTNNRNQGEASEIQIKYNTLQKEILLLKEEHQSNIKDLKVKIDQQDSSLLSNDSVIKEHLSKIQLKEKDIVKLKDEIEKLNKNFREAALQHSQSLKLVEEGLQRKTKEFDALARSKNCKGCVICTEDAKDKGDLTLIKQLNDSLIEKSARINSLEEQVRKSSALVNQVCQHNFSFLRQKQNDFYGAQSKTKQNYENRLMEVEELLGLEKKRCEDVIKSRVAILEEKYLKAQNREQEFNKKIKELNFQIQNQDKEVRSHITKIKEYQNQIQKLQTDQIKATQEKKQIEDASKKLENQFMEESKKVLELQKKLLQERSQQQDAQKLQQDQDKKVSQVKNDYEEQIMEKQSIIMKLSSQRDDLQQRLSEALEEKSRMDERFKKEQQTLTKQLKELRENYEKEIREKNEKILYLNNTINEQLDKQQDFSKQSAVSNELYEKQKRDIQTKAKDLQELTSLMQKKSTEMLKLQQEIEKVKSENSQMMSQIQNLQRNQENQDKENQSPKDLEIAKLKRQLLTIEEEQKNKSQRQEESESTIIKIKEFSAITCNIKDNEKWESNIAKILFASQHECINFMNAGEGVRVLFMPHSQGIYLAMVLRDQEDILHEMLKDKDINSLYEESSMKSSQQQPPVRKLNIRNNLFLDIKSMSKNMQTILEQVIKVLIVYRNYQMIVIARIKSISQHKATEQLNPYELDNGESFFHCQIEKLEHIVGFESDDFVITDYVCK